MNTSLEAQQSSSIKRGDVVRLGDHVLCCGDAATVDIASLHQGTIDLILTDPPYAVDYAGSKRGIGKISVDKDIENDGLMNNSEYCKFTKDWLYPALSRLSAKNSIYVFNSDKMIFALDEAFDALGIKVAQLLVWIKDRAVIGRLDYLPQHELILYGWYGTHLFRRGKDKTVICVPKPAKNALHPTMKPVTLLRRLILNSSEIGDVVYDPFGGSGSTLIACEQTKRRCIMVEIDPEYCATIIARWTHLTGHDPEIIRREA